MLACKACIRLFQRYMQASTKDQLLLFINGFTTLIIPSIVNEKKFIAFLLVFCFQQHTINYSQKELPHFNIPSTK